MTGLDFISLAGRLAALNDEAARRSAVSRSYYGAFHLANGFLEELGCPVNTSSHLEPVHRLSNSRNEHAKLAGQLLNELQGARIKADYKLKDKYVASFEFAREHVELAHSIRTELEKCQGADDRTAIRTAIEDYLTKRMGRG